jgi:hypothetical protein
VSSGLNQLAFARIRLATCAIGALKVGLEEFANDPSDPRFKILGTGFLIAPRLVLTNRHVALNLNAFLEKDSAPKDRRYAAFLRPNGEGLTQSFHEFEKIAIVKDQHYDVGLITLRSDSMHPPGEPVLTSTDASYQVGDPVGVYGYAFGEGLLKREFGERERIYRFGPVLQQGYISGLAPYDLAGLVDRILLDVRTAKGMSGAPVFDPRTGCVIGLHSSGIDDTVAFAIPISSDMIMAFCQAAKDSVPGSKGTTDVRCVSRAARETGTPDA